MQNKTEIYSDINNNKTFLQELKTHTLTKTVSCLTLIKYVCVEKYKCRYGGKIHVLCVYLANYPGLAQGLDWGPKEE